MNQEKVFCPNCGSEDIEPRHEDIWGYVVNPNTWQCNNCGYKGLAPEGDRENTEFDPETSSPVILERAVFSWKRILAGLIFLLAIILMYIALD